MNESFEFTGDRLKISPKDYLFAQCLGNGYGAWVAYYLSVGRMPPLTMEAVAEFAMQAAEAGLKRSSDQTR